MFVFIKKFIVDANRCVYSPSSDWLKCGEFINNYWIDLMFEEVDGVNYCYASPPHLMGDYERKNYSLLNARAEGAENYCIALNTYIDNLILEVSII